MKQQAITAATCYHCGEGCNAQTVVAHDRQFCCEGCRMVYEILEEKGMCDYYTLSQNPGTSARVAMRKDKFAFLDDASVSQSLLSYSDERQSHVTFYLPQVHCSSCLWLLENLHRLNEHIISSRVNFSRKEAEIIFSNKLVSLRQVAELLTAVGYEPYISLKDLKREKPGVNRSKIYKLGVAGFCFANIMLLSFPEYLGIDATDVQLVNAFRWFSLVLSLPVVFYSAAGFYNTAWKSLQHRFMAIDTPIVVAIWVTFGRSLYEVISGQGSGYFDSMSGIVFFMLIGRVLQQKTYDELNFDRDYTSYFPIAVTRVTKQKEEPVTLGNIQVNDTLLIHANELIPVDGILTRGQALIDYSFVTGESLPVLKEMGELVYAGGRQTGSNIEVLAIKETDQSYLTRLWNRGDTPAVQQPDEQSFVHLVSRYFTWGVFDIAGLATLYWAGHDPSKILNAITSVLIVACPCALLLSNTFTNGNIIRLLSRNKLYLRNAQTIEKLAEATHIVFDKTGTLSDARQARVQYEGRPLSPAEKAGAATLAKQSNHPLSTAIASFLGSKTQGNLKGFCETPGKGIEGLVDGELVALGSQHYLNGTAAKPLATEVYVAFEGIVAGKFVVQNEYRSGLQAMIKKLQKGYSLSVMSGDNNNSIGALQKLFGPAVPLHFNQSPAHKLAGVERVQQQGHKVIMIGDGLNDAAALKQADVGIAISDQTNNLTPASDAILEAAQLPLLPAYIRLCKANRRIVFASFVVSIIYNLVGLFFAVQGNLSPMIAAILMPASSITILLITYGAGNLVARRLGL